MMNYEDLVRRYDELWKRLKDNKERKKVTRQEIKELAEDMAIFIKEDHPNNEKTKFYPLGYLESLGFLLDESNPDKTIKFADD